MKCSLIFATLWRLCRALSEQKYKALKKNYSWVSVPAYCDFVLNNNYAVS